MKLRNKKTGEVFDALIREKGGSGSYSLIVCDIKAYEQSKSTLDATHFVLDEYDSLAELNEEWEDYEQVEPLIEKEMFRKAVAVWAEANGYYELLYDKDEDCLYSPYGSDNTDTSVSISFDYIHVFDKLEHRKLYNITQLCGLEK